MSPAEAAARARARAALWARLDEPHVAPLVTLADGIAVRHGLMKGAVPYPDPDGGGVLARVLFLLNDPGDGAMSGTGGSGMLTVLNSDPTSNQQRKAIQATGLDLSSALHWNGIPWPVAVKRRGDIRPGAVALLELLELLPDLRGVVTLGAWARDVWRQARSMGDRCGHLAYAHGPHPSRSSDVALFAAYRRAVEIAAML